MEAQKQDRHRGERKSGDTAHATNHGNSRHRDKEDGEENRISSKRSEDQGHRRRRGREPAEVNGSDESESDEQDRKSSRHRHTGERNGANRRRTRHSAKRKRSRSSSEEDSSDESSDSDVSSSSSRDSDEDSAADRKRKHRSKSETRREDERRKRKKHRSKEKEMEKEKEREERKRRKLKEEKKRRKKARAEKLAKGPITSTWGKYGILKEIDMWNKRPEFSAWLGEVKKVNLETLSNWEEKQMFKEYMEDYNTATFPSKKYYNVDIYHRRKVFRAREKGMKAAAKTERTEFNDEEQRRLELRREREQQKEAEVDALKQAILASGQAQAMREQAQLREEMQYQFRLGNSEAAAAIQRRLDPDAAIGK